MQKILLSLILGCMTLSAIAQENDKIPAGGCSYTMRTIPYKQIEALQLEMLMVRPDDIGKDDLRPAIIFIHGGGWNDGSLDSFENHCRYFATQGLVTFSISYRLRKTHGATPLCALQDAKSAVRYVRENAEEFGVDPNKIITSGGSAGGHLAAAVTLCSEINDPNDDLTISSAAAANILFNPVVCNGPETQGAYTGYGYERVKEYYEEFSPMYNVREGTPPTIFMVGDQDHLIPTDVAQEYKRLIEAVGGRCDLHIYPGQKHGFYHFGKTSLDKSNFYRSVSAAHQFLSSLGYLDTPPAVGKWLEAQQRGYQYAQ